MSMSPADIYLCACGRVPTLEAHRPPGRVSDLHRITCACGLEAPRWSVSAGSAIRFWNSIIISGESLPDEEDHASRAAG